MRVDLKDPISVAHFLVEGKTLEEFKKLYKGMIPGDPLAPEDRYKKVKAEIKFLADGKK